jgi:protein TonB
MFQELLERSGSPVSGPSRWRRSAPLAAAAGLHGLAAVLILGARLSIDEPEPPIRLIFPEGSRIPAQLGDGKPAHARSGRPPTAPVAPAQRAVVPAVQTVQPTQPDDRWTDTTPPDAQTGTEVGKTDDGGGGSGGDPTGTHGGTGFGPDGPGSDDALTPIHNVGGKVVAPQLILRIEPVYPEATRRSHAEGTVVLEAIISALGTVENVRVLKTTHPLLDAAAVRAVELWRYQAATLNGRPVRVYLAVTVTFSLR